MISGKKIESVVTDPSGTVIAMVLNDATGESWVWGAVEGASEIVDVRTTGTPGEPDYKEFPIYDYKVKITTLEDDKEKSYTIDVDEQVEGLSGNPIPLGLPRAALSNTGEMNLTSKQPIRVGAASLSAFDGYTSVKYNDADYRKCSRLEYTHQSLYDTPSGKS